MRKEKLIQIHERAVDTLGFCGGSNIREDYEIMMHVSVG